jgi:hypothetical protein
MLRHTESGEKAQSESPDVTRNGQRTGNDLDAIVRAIGVAAEHGDIETIRRLSSVLEVMAQQASALPSPPPPKT